MRRRLPLLLVLASLPFVLWALVPVPSDGATSPGEIQSKIDRKKSQIQYRKGRERVLTSDISRYSDRIEGLQSDIDRLQARQTRLESDLAAKRAELGRIQTDLRKQRLRLERLKARLAQARTALAQRLRAGYMDDTPDIVTVVLEADGFADLLERSEFLERIADQDTRIIGIVRSAQGEATSAAAQLKVSERRQRTVTAAAQQRRNEVASVRGTLVGRRSALESARSGKSQLLASSRERRQSLQDDVTTLVATQRKIEAKLAQAQGGGPIKQGSGSMIWPVNGPITSPFCESRAWESCHPGIDIGVPSGTPVHAALGGRVALVQSAASSGGYGNFVCIQHSGSLSTCYAHNTSIGVSVGQNVSKGQVISISGCTGRCFGPHVHFEVRVNGSVVNPMNYL